MVILNYREVRNKVGSDTEDFNIYSFILLIYIELYTKYYAGRKV